MIQNKGRVVLLDNVRKTTLFDDDVILPRSKLRADTQPYFTLESQITL